jgi:hypothetical protein
MGRILVLLDGSDGSTSPIDGAANELLDVDQDRRGVLDRAGEAEATSALRQYMAGASRVSDFGRIRRSFDRGSLIPGVSVP